MLVDENDEFDPQRKNTEGESAMEIARLKEHPEMWSILMREKTAIHDNRQKTATTKTRGSSSVAKGSFVRKSDNASLVSYQYFIPKKLSALRVGWADDRKYKGKF